MKNTLIGIFVAVFSIIANADAIDDALKAQNAPAKTQSSVDNEVLNRSKESEQLVYQRAMEKERARAAEFQEIDVKMKEGKSCTSNCYKSTRRDSNSSSIDCLVGASKGRSETVWHYTDRTTYSVAEAGGFKTFDQAARFVCGY